MHPGPRCATITRRQKRRYAEEDAAWREIKRHTHGIIGVLKRYPHLWQQGDGFGGAILHSIAEEAVRHGFDGGRDVYRPDTLIEMLGERDGWSCRYCEVRLQGDPSVAYPYADHVVAKSKGGPDHIDNRVLACRSCNSTKGAKSAEEFLAYRERKAAE